MPPASKKRKVSTGPAPAEITFDFAAREEYLTGFHKRKLERIKHAQTEAAKKEREEKLRLRAEMRQQRKVDLEKHVKEVNALLRKSQGLPSEASDDSDSDTDAEDSDSADKSDEEFTGFDDAPINEEDEYVDEDKYTTVTIETVGISKDGFERPGEKAEEEQKERERREQEAKEKRVWTKEKPKREYPKKKKKKFRYESKAERKAQRVKVAVKKKALAEKRSQK